MAVHVQDSDKLFQVTLQVDEDKGGQNLYGLYERIRALRGEGYCQQAIK
jgi:hypothetical protein